MMFVMPAQPHARPSCPVLVQPGPAQVVPCLSVLMSGKEWENALPCMKHMFWEWDKVRRIENPRTNKALM